METIKITAQGFVGEPTLKKKEKCEKCSIITLEELEALFLSTTSMLQNFM